MSQTVKNGALALFCSAGTRGGFDAEGHFYVLAIEAGQFRRLCFFFGLDHTIAFPEIHTRKVKSLFLFLTTAMISFMDRGRSNLCIMRGEGGEDRKYPRQWSMNMGEEVYVGLDLQQCLPQVSQESNFGSFPLRPSRVDVNIPENPSSQSSSHSNQTASK